MLDRKLIFPSSNVKAHRQTQSNTFVLTQLALKQFKAQVLMVLVIHHRLQLLLNLNYLLDSKFLIHGVTCRRKQLCPLYQMFRFLLGNFKLYLQLDLFCLCSFYL